MNLKRRMQAIVDLCPAFGCWADIGCDHGRISAALLLQGKANRVIATDVSAPSLEKARALCARIGISGNVAFCVGDGLEPLGQFSVQGAVLSGMGAPLICGILLAQMQIAKTFRAMVLSPNNYPERLREFLSQHGFCVKKERMVKDQGKYYPVLLVLPEVEEAYTPQELLIGRNVVADGDFKSYLQDKCVLWEGIECKTGRKPEKSLIYQEALQEYFGTGP